MGGVGTTTNPSVRVRIFHRKKGTSAYERRWNENKKKKSVASIFQRGFSVAVRLCTIIRAKNERCMRSAEIIIILIDSTTERKAIVAPSEYRKFRPRHQHPADIVYIRSRKF